MIKKLLLVVAAAISLGAASNSHAFFGFGSGSGSSSPVFPERGAELGSPSFTTEKVNKTPVLMGSNYLKYLDSVSCLEPNASMPWNTRLVNYINPSAVKCDVKPPAYKEKAAVSISEKKGVKYVRIISSGPDWDGKAWTQRQYDESLFAYNPETGYMIGVTYETLFGDNEPEKQQFTVSEHFDKLPDACPRTEFCNISGSVPGPDKVYTPIAWYAFKYEKSMTDSQIADHMYSLRIGIDRTKLTAAYRYLSPNLKLKGEIKYFTEWDRINILCDQMGENNQFCEAVNKGYLLSGGKKVLSMPMPIKAKIGHKTLDSFRTFVKWTQTGLFYEFKQRKDQKNVEIKSMDEDGDEISKTTKKEVDAKTTAMDRRTLFLGKILKHEKDFDYGSHLLNGWDIKDANQVWMNKKESPQVSRFEIETLTASEGAALVGLTLKEAKKRFKSVNFAEKCPARYSVNILTGPGGRESRYAPVVHDCFVGGNFGTVVFELSEDGRVTRAEYK